MMSTMSDAHLTVSLSHTYRYMCVCVCNCCYNYGISAVIDVQKVEHSSYPWIMYHQVEEINSHICQTLKATLTQKDWWAGRLPKPHLPRRNESYYESLAQGLVDMTAECWYCWRTVHLVGFSPHRLESDGLGWKCCWVEWYRPVVLGLHCASQSLPGSWKRITVPPHPPPQSFCFWVWVGAQPVTFQQVLRWCQCCCSESTAQEASWTTHSRDPEKGETAERRGKSEGMSPSTRTDAGCEGFAGCGEGIRKEKGVRLWRKHESVPGNWRRAGTCWRKAWK